MKKEITILVASIIVIIFVAFLFSLRAVSKEGEAESFRVSSGEGLRLIAARLESEELIRSRIGFSIYGFLSGTGRKLKPGLYELSPDLNSAQIARALAEGQIDITIAIIEGETASDIDRKLTEAGIVTQGEFLILAEPFEGFLFPDTYRLSPEFLPRDVLVKLLKNFRLRAGESLSGLDGEIKKIINCFEGDSPEVCGDNINLSSDEYEELIVASLVEKEVPSTNERPTVAGVIYKRLKIGMPVQVDATIVYSVCGKTFSNCRPLTRGDYKIDSAYNTYENPGLPPTPISNPGLDAIEAAVSPKTSEYLYYLSDPDSKRTIFSSTLEEHNEKRAIYLGL